jgi:hypothetical protein
LADLGWPVLKSTMASVPSLQLFDAVGLGLEFDIADRGAVKVIAASLLQHVTKSTR